MLKTEIKKFKADVRKVLKANVNAVTMHIQNIGSGTHAFVDVPDIRLSMYNVNMVFFVPLSISYVIPYGAVLSYVMYEEKDGGMSMEVELMGRQLLSIRPHSPVVHYKNEGGNNEQS